MKGRNAQWIMGLAVIALATPAVAQRKPPSSRPATVAAPPMVVALPAPPRPAPSPTITPDLPTIAFDQTVNENFASDGRCVLDPTARFYQFRVDPDTRIEAVMRSSSFDTLLEVGNFDGCEFNAIGRNDDGSGANDGTNSRLSGTLARGGTYVLKASALSGRQMSGNFSVTLRRLPALPVARTATPTPIRVGQPVTGRLTSTDPVIPTTGGDSDFSEGGGRPYRLYALSGRAGQSFTVSLDSDDFDSFLEAGTMSGIGYAAVLSDDDGGDGLNSRLTVTFQSNDTMIIRVSPLRAGSTGRYSLSVTPAR
jgi:hypothetical protein